MLEAKRYVCDNVQINIYILFMQLLIIHAVNKHCASKGDYNFVIKNENDQE